MDKGKTKKENGSLSIMVVPHTLGEVKTYNINSFYKKLTVVLAALLISLFCMAIFVYTTVTENQKLKSSISDLCTQNNEQLKLLNDKASEISRLKSKDDSINEKIRDFADKYREITDNYISSSIKGASSRSGDRNDRSFSTDISELRDILDALSELNKSDVSNLVDLTETESKLKEYLDSVPAFWPVYGKISDNYGYRTDPFTKKKTFHEGLDISAPYGNAIKASASGKVVFSGKKSGYGNAVIIDHGHGIKTLYGHASKLLVKEGQKVNKGDVIAKVGSSGRSTGPHLHFEVLISNTPVDPLNYLDKK